jgi:predicted metal-dependent hydrolase
MKTKFYVYTPRRVKRAGREHGRSWKWKLWPFLQEQKEPLPGVNQQEPAAYEEELRGAASEEIHRISLAWKKLDETLKPEYCAALRQLQLATDRHKKESAEELGALDEFNKAVEEMRKIQPPNLNRGWMLFWLMFIGAAEFPLNALAFQIFGEGRLLTYIIAAAMCIGIPYSAHFVGSKMKQEIRKPTDRVLLGIVPVGVLLGIGVIAYLRAKFFEALETQHLLGIEISPAMASILFVIVNIFLFLFAFLVSYEGTHSDEEGYRMVRKRFKLASQILQRESREARASAKELEKAELRYQHARQKREAKFRAYAADALHVKESFEWLTLCYREANMAARNNPTLPECFKKPSPEFTLPKDLTELDWTCEGMTLPGENP